MKTAKLCSMLLVLAFAVLSGACSENVVINSSEKKNIALIAKMNTGYYWGTVKLGADAAAREFNVNEGFYAPGDEEDVDEQIRLVTQGLDGRLDIGRVDALILAASDYKALVKVTEKAYDKGIPVIVIDSEVDTKKINCFIATDNLEAGKKAGRALIDKAGTKCDIAIMSFVKGSWNAEQREEGLLGVISEYPGMKVVAREYCLSDTGLAYDLTKKILQEHTGVNAVVALNEIASEGVARAIDELKLGGKVKVIAFDSTTQEIDYLEKGVIQATVVQNPFSMGYLAVKFAVDAMEGKKPGRLKYLDSKVIDRDIMYLPENQKLLFPFIK